MVSYVNGTILPSITTIEVLCQQVFEDLKKSIPLMYDYIDVFFRISDDIDNTVSHALMTKWKI